MRQNRLNLLLALKFALREMRGGLSGFYIFLACIVLGVAAIAAGGPAGGPAEAAPNHSRHAVPRV